jgi:hypothetical protein
MVRRDLGRRAKGIHDRLGLSLGANGLVIIADRETGVRSAGVNGVCPLALHTRPLALR